MSDDTRDGTMPDDGGSERLRDAARVRESLLNTLEEVRRRAEERRRGDAHADPEDADRPAPGEAPGPPDEAGAVALFVESIEVTGPVSVDAVPSVDPADSADSADENGERGGDPGEADDSEHPAEHRKPLVVREVGALLAQTRAVIERTRQVIEQTKASLTHADGEKDHPPDDAGPDRDPPA